MDFKPTLKNKPTDMGKRFEKKFGQQMNINNVDLNEMMSEVEEMNRNQLSLESILENIDSRLNEDSFKTKREIWSLPKMEALVHSDPKLSAVYEEMAEDGKDKYGYHYNETIMNIIFNEYVLNSVENLEKYKMAIPVKKKRRDKSGIEKIKQEKGNNSKDEGYNHNNSLPSVMEDSMGNDRDYLNHRIEKKYETMDENIQNYYLDHDMEFLNRFDEKTVETSNEIINMYDGDVDNAIDYVERNMNDIMDAENVLELLKNGTVSNVNETTTASSSGSYETPHAFAASGKPERHSKKPAWDGGEFIQENYLTSSDFYKRLYESLDNDSVVPMSEDDDPYWDGYEQIGMKEKNGKEVPNCVPKKNENEEVNEHHLETREEKEEFIKMNYNDYSDFFSEMDDDIDSILDNASDEDVDAIYRSLEGEVYGESENLDEKSKSKKQQKFMGMVRGIQKGELNPSDYSDDVQKAAKEMSSDDVEDFASTKHDDLPEKIDEIDNQTFFNTVEKMKDIDQNPRKKKLVDTYFHEFIGKPFLESKITNFDMDYSNNNGDDYLGIDIMLENGKKVGYLVLVQSNRENLILPKDSDNRVIPITRKDARLISNIIKKINPESKYAKSGTADLPIGEYMNEVNPIVGAMAAGAASKVGEKVAGKLMGEDQQQVDRVEFYKDKPDEVPFKLKGVEWIEVWAKYPDGKIDVGYLHKGQDVVYSWDWFHKNILDESIIDHQDDTMAMSGNNPTSMKMKAESENKLENFGKSKDGVGGYNGYGQPMRDVNNIKNPSELGGKTKDNVNEDGFCRADEKPVPGKVKGEEGACKKKKNYKSNKSNNDDNKFNVEKRKEREKEYYKRINKKPNSDMSTKKKENVNEDKKTPSMVQVDRIKKENPKNFKSDMKDSASADYVEKQDKMTAQEQYSEVDDPQKMSADIEKEKLKQNKGEAFENEGNSTNDNNKEIPKRNRTSEEEEEVALERGLGMHDLKYDNEPDERFEERMKKDMGEEIYELRQKKMNHRAKAPMYNRDTQKYDKGDEKDQYNEFKNESVITGKYRSGAYTNNFVDFYVSEANEIESDNINESYVKLNLDGIGNTFTSRVDENVDVRNIMNKFDFYFNRNNNKVVKVSKGGGLLNENNSKQEEKPQINEALTKMKILMNYNPNDYNGVEKTKKYRGF